MADTTLGSRRRDLVPSGALLDTWSGLKWSEGVQIDRLPPLDRLTIRTRNSVYEVVVVAPTNGEVFVRGGAFFPEFTRAQLAGSSLGGSFLKVRAVHVGF